MIDPSTNVVSLRGAEYFDDPFATYTRLRRDTPIARAQADMMIRGTGYVVTRYDDVKSLYADRRFSSDAMRSIRSGPVARFLPPIVRLLGDTMVMKDGLDHKRIRSIVQSAFSPSTRSRWTDDVHAITDDLVHSLIDRTEIDVVEDYAVQLPLRVIARLLGVSESDRHVFQGLAMRMHALPTGKWGLVMRLRLMSRLVKFLEHVISDARARPGDNLVTAVIEARDGQDRLSERELLAMVFLLFYAGHDTTSNLLSNSVFEMLRHRDQFDSMREANDAAWRTAIGELLRYTSPVTCGSTRTAIEDVMIGDVRIPRGSQVLGMIVSANRDESVFDNPDRLDLSRQKNPHLAFAAGPHFCLGHHLAVLEGTVGLKKLVDAFPSLQLSDPTFAPKYRPDLSMRAMRTLPVRLR